MDVSNRLLVSILAGELLTLSTGLIQNTPPLVVGAEHYGFPVAWLFRFLIGSQYNPWRMDLLNFFADTAIWFVIMFALVFVVEMIKKRAGRH